MLLLILFHFKFNQFVFAHFTFSIRVFADEAMYLNTVHELNLSCFYDELWTIFFIYMKVLRCWKPNDKFVKWHELCLLNFFSVFICCKNQLSPKFSCLSKFLCGFFNSHKFKLTFFDFYKCKWAISNERMSKRCKSKCVTFELLMQLYFVNTKNGCTRRTEMHMLNARKICEFELCPRRNCVLNEMERRNLND